jgi:hypothetical protein
MMLERLHAAITAGDWPAALALALDAWRYLRSPMLADLVDRITTRCPSEPVPRQNVHRWWMEHARRYDRVLAGSLLAAASDRVNGADAPWPDIVAGFGTSEVVRRIQDTVERSFSAARAAGAPQANKTMFRGIGYRNYIERLAALASWPDDPRVARVAARWLVEAKVAWPYPHDAAALVFYELLADLLVRLRDTRVVPHLERVIVEPTGNTIDVREHQRALASRVIDALAATALAPPLEDDIATWCPVYVEPMEIDERALWRDAAGGDLGARLVLADHLLQRGDRRGEIITLACSGSEDNARRGAALLHDYWDRWMGELALVLDRGHCRFIDGLMDIATIGIKSTPEGAYAKVARHRELASVRTVRPGWNASENGYVAFLLALEEVPPRVRVNPTMIELLAKARASWPVQHLELAETRRHLDAALPGAMQLASALMPDVEVIDFAMLGEINRALVALVAQLTQQFPKLRRVHIDAARWLPDEQRTALAQLARLPFVEVDHVPREPS